MKFKVAAGVALSVVLGLLVIGCGGGGSSSSTPTSTEAPATEEAGSGEATGEITTAADITPAPAFSEAELQAVPEANWISPAGGTTGDRYSGLKEITDANASQLKGDWMTELNGSGALAKFSQEASPVEYEGVIYVPTGADDIFAISGATGKILWVNKGHIPASTAPAVCCGWDNRGVAIGDGMVYSAVLNGYVEAIDQKTGETVWKSPVAPVSQGNTVTMAPLYEDGKVFIGPVGAEYGVRGFLAGYDAKTGKQLWKHWNVPGPGEPGHDSWPKDNDLWKRGGATTWNTPTVDPKLGLIYYATANAGEDFEGGERPGDNLYASSIIALDMDTGKMAWYYQVVHHDIWDFDCPSPTVLMNVEVEGQMREAVAEPCKTGYVYFLDRKTGKPIFPIPEKKVPQNKLDATAPTEPVPTMPPFSEVKVTPAQVDGIQKAVDGLTPKGKKPPKVLAGEEFTPWGSAALPTLETASNTGSGGNNWPPSSFDQANDYYYVCSQNSASGSNVLPQNREAKYTPGETFIGENPVPAFGASLGLNAPGQLTAYDLTTGKIAWEKHFPDSCYSGAVSTAGNVVFVGRNKGELEAYDATTGKQLWSFQTGAGANAPVSIYEVNGKERVVLISGGNSLAGTSHGDNLWQFSLEGTKGPVAEGSGAKAAEHAGAETSGKEELPEEESAEAESEAAEAGETANTHSKLIGEGESVFSENCSTCHGATGHGGNGGPDLRTMPLAKTQAGAEKQVTNGGGGMPAFKGQLSPEEIEAVAAYVSGVIVGGK